MIKKLIVLFFGREKKYKKLIAAINRLEPGLGKLSGEELKAKSEQLKKAVRQGESKLDDFDLVSAAFALVRESAKRTLNQRHFDVQLCGGLVLAEGKIAEMLTGEGKTLTATLAVYLHGLSGKGVHIVTVNDYLARRDAVWMGQVYQALGLSVGCLTNETAYLYDADYVFSPPETPEAKSQKSKVKNDLDKERDSLGGFKVVQEFLRPVTRREAYLADITYGTNSEFGFDYLRDNLAMRLSEQVQRPLNFALIDEVDSILIDEARTPLIIAAPDSQASQFYQVFSRVVAALEPEEDYVVDEKAKAVNITQKGIDKTEKMLRLEELYGPENFHLVHYLETSLKAKALYRRDRDYIVKNGEVLIVDQFTGHLMIGRRYSGGLHQAIEAKEQLNDRTVGVKAESRTLAQITIQNYFRLYEKIAGMTGTAQTSAEEFHKVYRLEVITVPPNKPLVRRDNPDVVYKTRQVKYEAALAKIKELHRAGQPILIGTPSTDQNEFFSELLRKNGIPHEVLNAKNHEREGAIIAQAGRLKAVTVATNRAGRGVDIILGGYPPSKLKSQNSKFKIDGNEEDFSLNEEYKKWEEEQRKVKELGGLFVIGTERHEARRIDNQLRGRSGRQGDPGASQFFLSLEDDLLKIFGGDKIKSLMESFNMPEETPIESKLVSRAVNQAQAKVEGFNFDIRRHLLDFDDVLNKQRSFICVKRQKILRTIERGNFQILFREIAGQELNEEEKNKLNPELEKELGRQILRIIDWLWMENLENLEALREAVGLRAYGQHEPLVEYRRESYRLFQNFQNNLRSLVLEMTSRILANPEQIRIGEIETPDAASPKKTGRNEPCWCGSGKKYKKCHGS